MPEADQACPRDSSPVGHRRRCATLAEHVEHPDVVTSGKLRNRGVQALRGVATPACVVTACAARLNASTACVTTTFAGTSATALSWQHVAEHLESLPRRHRRRDARARHVGRRLGQLHAVDVARAVREDVRRAHAHDELRARELIAQRVVRQHRRQAVHAQPPRLLEVDEEQARRARACSGCRCCGTCRCRRSSGRPARRRR